MWIQDASGCHRVEAIQSVTADSSGNAVLHLNGGMVTTSTPYAVVVALLNNPPAPVPPEPGP